MPLHVPSCPGCRDYFDSAEDGPEPAEAGPEPAGELVVAVPASDHARAEHEDAEEEREEVDPAVNPADRGDAAPNVD